MYIHIIIFLVPLDNSYALLDTQIIHIYIHNIIFSGYMHI